MSVPRDKLAKAVVEQLAYAASNNKKRVRIADITKESGLKQEIVEKNMRASKIRPLESSGELSEEDATILVERLIYIHPEITESLVGKFPLPPPEPTPVTELNERKQEAGRIAEPVPDPPAQAAKVHERVPDLPSEPPGSEEPSVEDADVPLPVVDPGFLQSREGIRRLTIDFIIVDASNVLHWMKDSKLAETVDAVPLFLVLLGIKRKGREFCCYFDAKQIFEMKNCQPQQYQELEILRQRYPDRFSVITGGISADDFILLDAQRTGRMVLSNDRYRDNRIRLPDTRFLRGAIANCQVMIPDLSIIESLTSDLKKLVRDLDYELSHLIEIQARPIPRAFGLDQIEFTLVEPIVLIQSQLTLELRYLNNQETLTFRSQKWGGEVPKLTVTLPRVLLNDLRRFHLTGTFKKIYDKSESREISGGYKIRSTWSGTIFEGFLKKC